MGSFIIETKHKIFNLLNEKQLRKRFSRDIKTYNELINDNTDFVICEDCLMPILDDWLKEAGNLDSHYFLQDIIMAKYVNQAAPSLHYDIGSRIDGFIAHIIAAEKVGKVVMIDVRPLSVDVERLDFIQADATSLDNIEDESLESLSSLHAVEHFGLGRYGDQIDPDGWKKALHSMQAKIKKGGRLYFSVPVGPKNKLVFNAHRIFAPSTIIGELPNMKLLSFDYIHDMKVNRVDCSHFERLDDLVSEYDCGLFVFEKFNM